MAGSTNTPYNMLVANPLIEIWSPITFVWTVKSGNFVKLCKSIAIGYARNLTTPCCVWTTVRMHTLLPNPWPSLSQRSSRCSWWFFHESHSTSGLCFIRIIHIRTLVHKASHFLGCTRTWRYLESLECHTIPLSKRSLTSTSLLYRILWRNSVWQPLFQEWLVIYRCTQSPLTRVGTTSLI